MRARGAMQECNYPEFGNVLLPKLPFHFSETPVEFNPRTAMMGEDNAAVLGRFLGYSEEKIQTLMAAGVLAEDPRVSQARYLIASALGGEPTPPGILSGAEVRKKV